MGDWAPVNLHLCLLSILNFRSPCGPCFWIPWLLKQTSNWAKDFCFKRIHRIVLGVMDSIKWARVNPKKSVLWDLLLILLVHWSVRNCHFLLTFCLVNSVNIEHLTVDNLTVFLKLLKRSKLRQDKSHPSTQKLQLQLHNESRWWSSDQGSEFPAECTVNPPFFFLFEENPWSHTWRRVIDSFEHSLPTKLYGSIAFWWN